MAAKVAKVRVVIFNLDCPKCDESIMDPETGSYDFELNARTQETEFTCDGCGQKVRLPKNFIQKF